MSRFFLLFLLACGGGGSSPAPEAEEDAPIPQMAPERLLARASLDLRGVRPTPAELERLAADPAALDSIIEEYLQDPRFGDRIRAMYGQLYLTEADYFMVSAASFGIEDEPGFLAAVGQEPLRILGEVAASDLPWTDIVTADWTMANELTAQMYPLDYPEGETGWKKARYTDSRPAAGVLSTTGLWLRYTSTDSNANRKRANTASRLLLCNDYLTRPIEFDREVDLLDQEAVNDALQTNPACVNCHVSLDPLASYFFGFWSFQEQSWVDVSTYHPERENLWQDYTGVAPGFYGQPGDSLDDLGRAVAGDPRFPGCAVEQVYGLMLQRDVGVADTDSLTAHREAFLAGGLTMRSLVRSILLDPQYRAGATDASGAVPTKLLSPDLLASSVEDITGFRWTYLGYDMLKSDTAGLRTLAGGADGYSVTQTSTSPNATLVLVAERLAEAAASYAVAQDAALPAAERRLLNHVELTDTPASDAAGFTAQIQALHLRILGASVAADGEEVAANLALWEELYAIDADPAAAWTGLIAALLRDPEFLLY